LASQNLLGWGWNHYSKIAASHSERFDWISGLTILEKLIAKEKRLTERSSQAN
jgi:hypothetical protein